MPRAVLGVRCAVQGDPTSAGDTPEKTVENALWALKQEIKHKTDVSARRRTRA